MAPRTLNSSFTKPITMHDSRLIAEIARRATNELPYERIEVALDIEAVHEVTPLDLERFLAADLSNFIHDVVGIRRHLDRATGKLKDCFSPRFTKVREKPPMFTCSRCGWTSYNPNDLREGYCANCHSFVRDNP